MEALLADVARGAQPDWPFDDASHEREFVDAAVRHRLLPLVNWHLRQGASRTRWPRDLTEQIQARARQHAVAEQIQRIELAGLAQDLRERGVDALVFKGAALAYTHYVHPCHRPRNDTDLLVAEPQRERAVEVLQSRGYSPAPMTTGTLVMFQQTFMREDAGGIRHTCDLHWQIANRPAFASLLRFDELTRDARPLVALDSRVAAPSPSHALLIACVHRVAHHHDAAMLLWVYDIHLLASALTPAEADTTRVLAEERGIAAICSAALALAHDVFGTQIPAALQRLQPRAREPLAIFTKSGLRPIDMLASDLRALRGWRERARLLREHLFPARDYLRTMEGRLGHAPFPVLYARRIVRGASRWFKPVPPEF
jgi:hypothetical protein